MDKEFAAPSIPRYARDLPRPFTDELIPGMRLKVADVRAVPEWDSYLRLHIVMTMRNISEWGQRKEARKYRPAPVNVEDWQQHVWEAFNFCVKVVPGPLEPPSSAEDWTDEWNENWTALKDGSGVVGWAFGQFFLPHDPQSMHLHFASPLGQPQRHWRVEVELPISVRSKRPSLPSGVTVVDPWGRTSF